MSACCDKIYMICFLTVLKPCRKELYIVELQGYQEAVEVEVRSDAT